jgi:gamma-glutamyltranspeptidase / glutathione hydrolase
VTIHPRVPRAMVATSTIAAAEAGRSIFSRGGNAVDAAIATAAAAAVVEPCSNGLGGDLCAAVWANGRLYGLNATGPAPMSMTRSEFTDSGIPARGARTVTVPGGIGGWAALSERFGNLPLRDVLAPAIDYADNGFEVSQSTATSWARAHDEYLRYADAPWFSSWMAEFTSGGKTPAAGDRWNSPNQASTLRSIADRGSAEFYHGALAEKIAGYVQALGGFLSENDLKQYCPQWVEPISVRFRGHDIWSLPPNGQGIIALQALGILDQFGPVEDVVEHCHRQIEAIKLAATEGYDLIADPAAMSVSSAEILSTDRLRGHARLIGRHAGEVGPRSPARGGTVYLATSDVEGMFVSLIQSNFTLFGSGLVVPGTGISLHNRACGFTLESGHPNVVGPGKRPFHTIVPGFASARGEPVGPFGVMGAAMQPQGQVQLISNALDRALSPQQTIDLPRWRWDQGRSVFVEPTFPRGVADALVKRGHQVSVVPTRGAGYGRAQMIWRTQRSRVLAGGTDPRVDGGIVTW